MVPGAVKVEVENATEQALSAAFESAKDSKGRKLPDAMPTMNDRKQPSSAIGNGKANFRSWLEPFCRTA